MFLAPFTIEDGTEERVEKIRKEPPLSPIDLIADSDNTLFPDFRRHGRSDLAELTSSLGFLSLVFGEIAVCRLPNCRGRWCGHEMAFLELPSAAARARVIPADFGGHTCYAGGVPHGLITVPF